MNQAGWKCAKCGGFNITIDMETGKTTCNTCKSEEKPKRLDFEEYRNDSIEKEEQVLNGLKVLGTQVKVDPDLMKTDDLNDFTGLGL